jgi:hypothetical protein
MRIINGDIDRSCARRLIGHPMPGAYLRGRRSAMQPATAVRRDESRLSP